MAKVRMLVSLSGVDFSRNAGEEHECSPNEARRLIKSGQAEAIKAEKAEKLPPAETR